MGLVYDALEQAADGATICYAREIVDTRSDMQSSAWARACVTCVLSIAMPESVTI